MIFKRRYVPVIRDFPEGCGVPPQHKSNFGNSLMQSKCKEITVFAKRDFPDLSKKSKESSDESETGTSGIEGFDNITDVESNGGDVKEREEKKLEKCATKVRKISAEKKRKLSLYSSTTDVESNGGGVKENQEKKKLECSTKVQKISSEKKRILSLHSSKTDVESNGGGLKEHQEKKKLEKCATKVRKISAENKSLHNSTMVVKTEVVSSSKRVIVSGLAAKSKCPWSQPRNRGSRQVKD